MISSLIEEAFGNPAKIRILRILKKPGAGYMSINQLARATSLNSVTLARTLRSLQSLGLANYVQAGKAQLWRLSEGYAANTVGPILDAIEKSPNIIDQIKETVGSLTLPSEIDEIVLFGSIIRGEHTSASDVDLFIRLRKGVHRNDIDPFLDSLTEKISLFFHMNPSYLIKNPTDWKSMTPQLKQNILDGVVLYEKKPNKRNSKD